jgi:hypothetical protein
MSFKTQSSKLCSAAPTGLAYAWVQTFFYRDVAPSGAGTQLTNRNISGNFFLLTLEHLVLANDRATTKPLRRRGSSLIG